MNSGMSHRLVYICDWLPPDFGAVGQYSLQFARAYAVEGREVTLVGLSSEAASRSVATIGHGRLTIMRIKATPFDRGRLTRRLLWTLATNARLLAAALPAIRASDEVLFTGAPPFLLQFLVPVGMLLGKRLIYRITDFHPECLMASLRTVPIWLQLFHQLTWALRRRVDEFQVLGHDQRRRLEAGGIPAVRITLKRDPAPVAITGRETPLTPPGELTGYRLLLYSGNWGVAHDVDTFLEGYVRHHRQGTGRVGLWLNAVGGGADRVEAELRAAGVPVARSRPAPLELLPRLLVTADAHLITLKDAFVGYVMPSKVYGCIASRRPILFIGSELSDVHRLCAQANDGADYQRVQVGDAAGVARSLEAIAACVDGAAEAPAEAHARAASERYHHCSERLAVAPLAFSPCRLGNVD
jgi:hypothetical protein